MTEEPQNQGRALADEGVIPIHSSMHEEILLIKEVHLRRMNDDIRHLTEETKDLKVEMKEHRSESNERFGQLDSRIWWLFGVAVTTMLAVVGGVLTLIFNLLGA